MTYYTERHCMRTGAERTAEISADMYTLILDCCEKYYDHVAWRFPELCPDGNGCCGLDSEKMNSFLRFEIPGLYRDDYGKIDSPRSNWRRGTVPFNQYALLTTGRFWHSYFRHNDLSFGNTRNAFRRFCEEINHIFEKTGLLPYINGKWCGRALGRCWCCF